MPPPLRIVATQSMAVAPAAVTAKILDLSEWRSFRGYGPIPAIRAARFRRRTEAMVGTQIEVENDDGSQHVEEIVAWREGEQITLRMSEFTPPLSRLATHFIERWDLSATATGGCRVRRSFELHPRSVLGWCGLALLAPWLRRAVAAHLRAMAE